MNHQKRESNPRANHPRNKGSNAGTRGVKFPGWKNNGSALGFWLSIKPRAYSGQVGGGHQSTPGTGSPRIKMDLGISDTFVQETHLMGMTPQPAFAVRKGRVTSFWPARHKLHSTGWNAG